MTDAPAISPQPICACQEVHGFPCQFPDAPAEFPFVDKDWCRFHLPLMDAVGNPSPKAEWKVRLKDWQNFEREILKRLSTSLPLDDKQDGRADFRKVAFPDDFSITNLLGEKTNREYYANFSGVTFGINADFSNVHFGAPGVFAGGIFGCGTRFVNTNFANDADFGGVTFEGNVDFLNANFRNTANFSKTIFKGNANFSRTKFADDANFSRATFDRVAHFDKANFGNNANFDGAIFEFMANFWDARFGNMAVFNRATFMSTAHFNYATLGRELSFEETTFSCKVNFHNASFEDLVFFRRTKFHSDADFSTAKAGDSKFNFQQIRFTKAIFKDQAIFENRQFQASAWFDEVIFHGLPNFHGCAFHQGMSFHKTRFLKTKGAYDQEGFENDTATEALERAYRTLKLGMETLRARNEEAMFFALEMECRRNRSDIGLFERFAAFAYKHLSNYGQSIHKPLVWLIGFTALMWCVYYVTGAKTLTDLVLDTVSGKVESWEITKFTLEQIFRPFFVWSTSSGESTLALVKDNPLLIPIVASLQSLATIALLASSCSPCDGGSRWIDACPSFSVSPRTCCGVQGPQSHVLLRYSWTPE
ncbi:MAG: pentapeptide repeat-containing protein [Alphaproteobacteria bacterium]|nr:pentapeptide repeat-containing protein [Alphaproteobacteria bacterium]